MEREICSEDVSCYTGGMQPFKDIRIFPEDVNFPALVELLDGNEVKSNISHLYIFLFAWFWFFVLLFLIVKCCRTDVKNKHCTQGGVGGCAPTRGAFD